MQGLQAVELLVHAVTELAGVDIAWVLAGPKEAWRGSAGSERLTNPFMDPTVQSY